MNRVILFNKPYGVLSQFTSQEGAAVLADYSLPAKIYPAGRLDKDSEGLLVLTDNGALQQKISHPRFKLSKTYWAQVEGTPSATALTQLREGIMLNDGLTKPAQVSVLETPDLWPRIPPIRFRQHIPTSWLEISITEGRNRQVRRMTAAVGLPTLRLVRVKIGHWKLDGLQPGEWREAII
ncbi:MAG: pseudouridine synthase [Coxiellaceae bacterium]|nr:MAG: pseudouridine synthase [Coxiellaceae bacterium]